MAGLDSAGGKCPPGVTPARVGTGCPSSKTRHVATHDEATEHLREHAALTAAEASAVVDAVIRAAGAEAIDAIADDSPPPTALADVRAARVVRICKEINRMLRPIEVEVILRVPSSTAQSIINRVRATYPQRVQPWTQQLVAEQSDAPRDISTEDQPDHWQVTFKDPAVLEYAYDLLRRRGMTRNVTRKRSEQALKFPREVDDRYGQAQVVRQVLGIP